MNEDKGLYLLDKKNRYNIESTVSYPDDIVKIFEPHRGCEFAYWVLQSRPGSPGFHLPDSI
jgi:hypothetical protein